MKLTKKYLNIIKEFCKKRIEEESQSSIESHLCKMITFVGVEIYVIFALTIAWATFSSPQVSSIGLFLFSFFGGMLEAQLLAIAALLAMPFHLGLQCIALHRTLTR